MHMRIGVRIGISRNMAVCWSKGRSDCQKVGVSVKRYELGDCPCDGLANKHSLDRLVFPPSPGLRFGMGIGVYTIQVQGYASVHNQELGPRNRGAPVCLQAPSING